MQGRRYFKEIVCWLYQNVARGDVFSRVDPISVSNDEFRCSAASFSGGKATCQGLAYGNGI